MAFQTVGDPVLFLSNPDGVERKARRKMLDFVAKMNAEQEDLTGDPEIRTSIVQQEMAFRMQVSVPELTDLSNVVKNIIA